VVCRWIVRGPLDPRSELLWSRLTTLGWGALCMAFSFFVGNISLSIIESVNLIGSLVNGPILGTFLLAILTRRANDRGTMVGIAAGVALNLGLWRLAPGFSWLWWNVTGCAGTFAVGYLASLGFRPGRTPAQIEGLVFHRDAQAFFQYRRRWPRYYAVLAIYFVLMIGVLVFMQALFRAHP